MFTVSDSVQFRTMTLMSEAVMREQALTTHKNETNASYIKASETRGFLTQEERDEREELNG